MYNLARVANERFLIPSADDCNLSEVNFENYHLYNVLLFPFVPFFFNLSHRGMLGMIVGDSFVKAE